MLGIASNGGMDWWKNIDEFDEAPRGPGERAADAEHARMERKGDRLQARLSREGLTDEDRDRIFDEEMDRQDAEAAAERPIPTPWEEEQRRLWVDEMNAIAETALANMDDYEEAPDHPLVEACSDLGLRLLHGIRDAGWLSDDASHEHPLNEIAWGVITAGTKLAGALNGRSRGERWPPPAFLAGDPLVRLKKARGYLCDSLRGFEAAEAEHLATPDWLAGSKREVEAILSAVLPLIEEVRAAVEDLSDE